MLEIMLWLVAATGNPPGKVDAPALPHVGAAPCVCCAADIESARDLIEPEEWLELRRGTLLKRAHRIERGESVSGGADATSLLPYPPDQVWEVLTDFESWPRFMPHITASEITRREGQHRWVQQSYRIVAMPMRHTTVYELDPRRGRLAWELDPDQPSDIADSKGHWQLIPADQGRATLVRYSSQLDSGRRVPSFVERILLERSLGALFSSLRGELERRYRESPE